jgi:hypothetical protein
LDQYRRSKGTHHPAEQTATALLAEKNGTPYEASLAMTGKKESWRSRISYEMEVHAQRKLATLAGGQ